MNIKAILFDVGGTLIQNIGTPFIDKIVKLFNVKISKQELSILKRKLQIEAKNIEDFSSILSGKIKQKIKSGKILELYESENKLHIDHKTDNILKQLKLRNYKLGIISNCSVLDKLHFKNLFLKNYFDIEVRSCDYGFYKPQKEIFKVAERFLGYKSEEIAYVGDNYVVDILGAKRMGWKTILFCNRTTSNNTDINHEIKITDLIQLLDIFG